MIVCLPTAKTLLEEDAMSGHVFLFVNRKRTTCKALVWDGTGFMLICKRLESGQFTRFNEAHNRIEMTGSEFSLFLEGSDIKKRFIESRLEFELPMSNLNINGSTKSRARENTIR
tara:strand:+ start:5493 stop:5837 length:345 start_codon:yes stop_codon:yes gene_type:complete